MLTKAVYAGSFDPITNGHMWMIKKGSEMFDQLIVSVGTNPEKRYTFDATDRFIMLADAIKEELPKKDNITLATFEKQMLIKYARKVGGNFLLRGIRSVKDYEYEKDMMHINSDMEPNITTVFLFPPRDIAEISSSAVKGLVGYDGWEEAVQKYVPSNVFEALQNRANKQES
jgi:pantetheine-phosphate adenylyltransferase